MLGWNMGFSFRFLDCAVARRPKTGPDPVQGFGPGEGGRHGAEAVQGAEQIIGKLREAEVALAPSEGVG